LEDMAILASALFALTTFAGWAQAVNPVIIRGREFVDTVTNQRVQIIGVDYQPGGQAGYNPEVTADALSNGTVCLRDAALMQMLGVNTIRVYNVNPEANHDECASIFNTAGIYMLLDVNSPEASINRAEPWTSYTNALLTRIFGVVEGFKDYPNTMAFFSANEVMNDLDTAEFNPPYIRAVQRDLRAYIANHSPRPIPVGYSAADVREILEDTWNYFQCGGNSTLDESRSELFGLNSYSWCGEDATYTSAGYDQLVAMFEQSSHPVFMSEYGCNQPPGLPRPFNEVQALYGSQMTALSGGLVYEYSQEPSDYGLVVINDNGTVTLRRDYDNLQAQYNQLDISLLQDTASTATNTTPPRCEPDLITHDGFSKTWVLPERPDGAEDLIENGIPNAPRGRLITIDDLDVSIPIYAVNGQQLSNIRVVAREDANVPGGTNTSGSATGSSSGPSPSSSSKPNSAVRIGMDAVGVLAMVGAAMFML